MKKEILFALACGVFLQTNAVSVHATEIHASKSMGETGRKEVVNKWEFWSMSYPVFSAERLASVEHVLGGEVRLLLDSINVVYVKREQIVPGDPQTRPVIRKPEIFKAVLSIEKYLKKEVAQQRMELNIAHETMLRVTRVALAAIDNSDTESFEEALYQRRKSATELLDVFNQVKLSSL